LSLGLHVAVLACLLMVHHTLTPGRDIGVVELVMVQPGSASAAAPKAAATPLDTAADHPPDVAPNPQAVSPPLPAVPDQPVVPPQDTVPEQQAVVPSPPVPDQRPAPDQPAALQPASVPPPAAQPQPSAPTAAPVRPEPPLPAPRPVRTPHPPSRVTMRANPPPHEPVPRVQSEDASGVAAPSAETSASPAASAPSAVPTQQTARAGADPGWLAGVGAWLKAHRSYPEGARALGRQGTVVVQITVDPAGRVVGVNLVQGSGTDSLDHAAEALVRDAQLPPFPPDMKLPRQSLTVPIRYALE
jgi:protein TonB